MSPHILYTAGYLITGCTPARLRSIAEELGAVVVDVRFSPKSWHRPEWSRKQLQQILGPRYLHLRALGNANYRSSGPTVLFDPESGVEAVSVLLHQRPVIAICACWNLQLCHRLLVANLVSERTGCRVIHLGVADFREPVQVEPAEADQKHEEGNSQLRLFSLAF